MKLRKDGCLRCGNTKKGVELKRKNTRKEKRGGFVLGLYKEMNVVEARQPLKRRKCGGSLRMQTKKACGFESR